MTTYLATPRHMTAPVRSTRSWIAVVRRVFEIAGAPYANSPYMPL